MLTKPRIYVDSCCFIDIVKHSIGIALTTDQDKDVWFLKKLLEAHRANKVIIHTSVLAVAECVAVEKGQSKVPEEVQERFRSLLTSGQYVQLLNPTPATALLVQNFRWKHEIVLQGADALHFSSALERQCVEFITTDDRLKSDKVAKAALVLARLGMRMIHASQTGQLPDEFRQLSTSGEQPARH